MRGVDKGTLLYIPWYKLSCCWHEYYASAPRDEVDALMRLKRHERSARSPVHDQNDRSHSGFRSAPQYDLIITGNAVTYEETGSRREHVQCGSPRFFHSMTRIMKTCLPGKNLIFLLPRKMDRNSVSRCLKTEFTTSGRSAQVSPGSNCLDMSGQSGFVVSVMKKSGLPYLAHRAMPLWAFRRA